MSSKRNMQIIDMLFSKACNDLQEGRFTNSICFLFFLDGYSPLLLERPGNHYLEFAGGVISSLNPEFYVYICVSYELNGNGAKGAHYISALVANRDGTNWVLKRPYEEHGGKVKFTGQTILPSSVDMKITGRAAELYSPLRVPPETEAKMKVIVNKVSSFLKVSKIPYSQVITKKEQ